MNLLNFIWIKFKTNPDVWFFYGFLITLTLSVRKVFFFYPINGQFNEWTGIYLYLSDIFLLSALFLWGILILRNKNVDLSTDNVILWLKQAIIYLPLLLVFWSFISILWSENQNIALFRAIKLLELFLLYIYVIYQIVPPRKECSIWNILRGRHGTITKNIFRVIIALGFIQAVIGIWQFIFQHSVGLFWLKESLISPDIPGVAKIVLNGEKFIRAYGLFPHPNILGGFLLLSIIITLGIKHGFNKKLLLGTILGIQIIALLLTFSKSAIIGLLIAVLYVLWKNKEMFRVEHLGKKAIIIAIILILSLYLAGLNFGENLEKSYGDRLSQLAIWKSITQNNLLLGIGTGNYMFHVKQNYPDLEIWQYQPVHDVFLLILSELGFVGLFIFVWFLWKLFHVEQMGKSHPERSITKSKDLTELDSSALLGMTVFKGILLGLIFIMFFDHYLWDIQQGQIMLWLILGSVAGMKKYN